MEKRFTTKKTQDASDEGCYCNDTDLRDMLRSLPQPAPQAVPQTVPRAAPVSAKANGHLDDFGCDMATC